MLFICMYVYVSKVQYSDIKYNRRRNLLIATVIYNIQLLQETQISIVIFKESVCVRARAALFSQFTHLV